jgi:diguanylate cyclase (GGDEF)-like protein
MKEILDMIRNFARKSRLRTVLHARRIRFDAIVEEIRQVEWPEQKERTMKESIVDIQSWNGWQKIRSKGVSIRIFCGRYLDSGYQWVENRSDHEKITAVVATFLLLIAADLLLGLHQAWKHVYYLPIWFAAWFLPRSGAMAIALIASAWLIVSPYLRGEPYTAGLILGLMVALTFFHFGGLSLSFLRDVFNRERRRARFDGLTDCLNATGLYEEGNKALSELRENFKPFAVVYLDLDNFKQLNDSMGHLRADEALVEIGKALCDHTRERDFVARMGGDEFVIWLNYIGPDLAFVITRRLYEVIEQVSKDGNWGLSASLGCVAFSKCPLSVHAALQAADDCMYRAKTTGKSKIVGEMWPFPGQLPTTAAKATISIR